MFNYCLHDSHLAAVFSEDTFDFFKVLAFKSIDFYPTQCTCTVCNFSRDFASIKGGNRHRDTIMRYEHLTAAVHYEAYNHCNQRQKCASMWAEQGAPSIIQILKHL